MISRVFFIFAGVISFCCILFFGYQLIHNKQTISPESIFNKQDGKLLIINNLKETNIETIAFDYPKGESKLVEKIIQNPTFSEKIFISSLRNRIVVEISSDWTPLSIKRYFKLKKIAFKVSGETYHLTNGFIAHFSNKLLIIGKEIISPNYWDKIEWPKRDKMASCNILHLRSNLHSEDIYCKGAYTTIFESNYQLNANADKTNDFETFGSLLPKGLSNYHFLTKNYAIITNQLNKNDLLYQWCDKGFVTFEFDGVKVLISDFKTTTDPFELLNEETEEEEIIAGSKSEYTGIKISKQFPQKPSGTLFVKYLEDKVVISENESTVNQVLAHYETGKTIALSEKAKKSIFENLPSEVCERVISEEKKHTISLSKNKRITVNKSQPIVNSNNSQKEQENTFTFSISDNILHIIDANNMQICFTENYFFALQNGNKLWSKPYEGVIVGSPLCQDILNNGELQLFFTTSKKIHLLDLKGNNLKGYPISLTKQAVSQAVFFDGKKTKNIFFVSSTNDLIKYNKDGRYLKATKLSITPNHTTPFVFKNGKQNLAVILGKNGGQLIQLDNLSKQNSFPTLDENTVFCVTETKPAFFYPEKEKLIRNDFTGKKTICGAYKNIQLLQTNKGQSLDFITFLSDRKFYMLDVNGNVIRHITLPTSSISYYQLLSLEDGNSIVGFLDNIENTIHLYSTQGHKITNTEFEGQDIFCLSETNQGIMVTTKGKNLIIQYKLENK